MAYMNQERKAAITPKVKAILKHYGLKGSLRVRNHSTLALTITEGLLDFVGNINRNHAELRARGELACEIEGYVSVHRPKEPSFSGVELECLSKLWEALHEGNYDNSDTMTDYFDVGWYVDLDVGRWNKPYICTAQAECVEAA